MIRVLTGATLIDGTGAAPVPDAAVVIDGHRITGTRLVRFWCEGNGSSHPDTRPPAPHE